MPPLVIGAFIPHIPLMRKPQNPGFGEAPQKGLQEARTAEGRTGTEESLQARTTEGRTGTGKSLQARSDTSDRGGPAARQGSKESATGKKNLRTSRGTSMGGRGSAKERAAVGMNPVPGVDVNLEDVGAMPASAVTATVEALSALIESGRPEFRDKTWVPHRPPRPEKSEGGVPLRIVSEFEPKGDQPTAIADLVAGVNAHERDQVLLGVTGSGKTYTAAKVIEATQRPALVLAPNKTLAAQLYGEFKSFFPDNAVEYFVSYYDYYQPEAYVPRTDTYIEKESSINEQIDRMRHSATRSLLERDDVIIVASVSCIYGIGSVETYTAMTFALTVGEKIDQRQLIADLVALQYRRADADFRRGTFRVRGDTVDLFPAHLEDRAWRINLFGDEVESITEFDPLTGQ